MALRTWLIWKKDLFYSLVLAFIITTIVGTLTHEAGHWLAAKAMGFDASMNYMSAFVTGNRLMTPLQHLYFTMGGPVETLLTGSIGLWLLQHKQVKEPVINQRYWLWVLLSLFWLRPLANLFMWLGLYVFAGYTSMSSDEVQIALYLNWPYLSIMLAGALAGCLVLLYILAKMPATLRFTFITAGITGGLIGFALWFGVLGKWVLP